MLIPPAETSNIHCIFLNLGNCFKYVLGRVWNEPTCEGIQSHGSQCSAHMTPNHKLQDGLAQQSMEPLLQRNRYGFTENRNKSFSECPVDSFSSHLTWIFMDTDYTSKNHLWTCSAFLGGLVTPGMRENSSMLQSALPIAREEEALAKQRCRSYTQAHTDVLSTVMTCCALMCFSHGCDFYGLISESGLLSLVSVEAQILMWNWFNLFDNWHVGLASTAI